jgi:hypothetical protein
MYISSQYYVAGWPIEPKCIKKMSEKSQTKPINTKTKVSTGGKVKLEKRIKNLNVRNNHNFKFSKEDEELSYFWAIQQILMKKCSEFEYPKEYVLNNR